MCLHASGYMSDYAEGAVGDVSECVLDVRVHMRSFSYVPISIFTDFLWCVWNNVWWQVHTYPGKWRCVHAEKQLLSISHTHTHKHVHMHFLWWMGLSILVTTVQMARHVIKHPSALLRPSLLTLLTTLSLTHTRRHLPHTWNYNYIFHFPTVAKQLPR